LSLVKFSEIRLARDERTFFATIKIYPGESGSPVFKEIMAGDTIKDLRGRTFPYNLKNKKGWVPVVLGHNQAFQKHFDRSNFSAPSQAQHIVEAYQSGRRLELSDARWDLKNGTFFRHKNTDHGLVQEANFLTGWAGDGIKGNGGDGIKGNGGGGTFTKGSDASEIGAGMIYNGLPKIAFRLQTPKDPSTDELLLYASWENYLYMERIRRQNPSGATIDAISSDQIAGLILEKVQKSENDGDGRDLCTIDHSLLDKNVLSLRLLTGAGSVETLNVPLNARFSPIHRTGSGGSESIIDVRGLFSVDASDFSDEREYSGFSEFEYYNRKPYVTIRKNGSSQELRLICRIPDL